VPALWSSAAPVRIAPIGDSITEGNNSRQSYRYPLWKKLVAAGVDFDFVGSRNTNDGWTPAMPDYLGRQFDRDHEGHTFNQSIEIRNGLQNYWMANYVPDIALVHAGTNDWWDDAAFTETYLRSIVEVLRARNPQIVILLAKLIPFYNFNDTQDYHNNRITATNARVAVIAAEMTTAVSPIIVVDQNTGFNRMPGFDSDDGTHPSAAGEEKMAQRWFDALLPIVGNPTLSAVTIASNHTNPALAKTGDAITLSFTASKTIQPPTVTIAGRAASVANPSGNTWTATITVSALDPLGIVPFSVAFTDLANHSGTPVTATSDGSTVSVPPPTIYETWTAQFALTGVNTLLTTDSDSDGLSNLLEFAYGLDPTVMYSEVIVVAEGAISERGAPRLAMANTQTGVDLRVIYGRRKDRAATGLSYAVQFSADLVSWVTSTATPTVLADDGTVEAVSVPYPFFVNGRKARFFHVVVTGP
jgi:lysophospholipase L1-like esterase